MYREPTPKTSGDRKSNPGDKKKRLSKRQKLMLGGATVSGVAALAAGILTTTSGGSGEKTPTTPQAAGKKLNPGEQGGSQGQFEQGLDPNEQNRLVSEGIDASTPQESLDKLFNAMSHDYRVLDAYANLTGAYNQVPPEALDDSGNAALLLDKNKNTLSPMGVQILGFVEEALTGSLDPESTHQPSDAETMLANGSANVQFVDLKDIVASEGDGLLYMTGMSSEGGLTLSAQGNTFGDNTKALLVEFPTLSVSGESGVTRLVIALDGAQPVVDGEMAASIPVGPTEADGHEPVADPYAE